VLKKGIFITFEGIDGSGKSTQLVKAAQYLEEKGISCMQTRDPGGTELGLQLRNILLNHTGKIYPFCELFLYLADRAQHVDEKIIPAINSGKAVLCDRFIDSTIAYQGYARGLNPEEITTLNNMVTHSILPDLTLLYDIDPAISLTRIGRSKDRLESESLCFHSKVREGYLEQSRQHPARIRVINANQPLEEVFKDTLKFLEEFLSQRI